MTRVIITRSDGQVYSGNFPSIEEAESWVSSHKGKGDNYDTEYIDDDQYDRKRKMSQLIDRRDLILKSTDWLFMSDVKTDQKHRRMYMQYRQYLRDLPALIGQKDMIGIEEFPHWLRRNHPEEFMDGGNNEVILHRFMYYYK